MPSQHRLTFPDVTFELFNQFGKCNASTTLISAKLGISPGNLYYHYPAKNELVYSLFDRYPHALNELINAIDGTPRQNHAGGHEPCWCSSREPSQSQRKIHQHGGGAVELLAEL